MQLKTDANGMVLKIKDYQYKQFPYITALTLTNVAKKAWYEVKSRLKQKFTLRNTWTAKGIRYQMANKRDFPGCFSAVYSRDWYMETHETGGTRKPQKRYIAVAVAARPNRMSRIPKRYRLDQLGSLDPNTKGRPGTKNGVMVKPKAFIMQNKKGLKGIWIRHGSSKGKPKRQELKLLYKFEDKTEYKKRDVIQGTCEDIAEKELTKEFIKNAEYVLNNI